MSSVMIMFSPDALSVHVDNQVMDSFLLGKNQLTEVLKSSPPSPYELEVAIEILENNFMPLVHKLPENGLLKVTGEGFSSLSSSLGKTMLSLDEVEDCFRRLADVSEGYPPVLEPLPTDADFYMQILILREFMHHLKFDAVEI